MRYHVRRRNGQFVAFMTIPGCSPPTTYAVSVADFQDAHDFGSESAAKKWLDENGGGKIETLEDNGYWPSD